jgi:fatty-acyl-CoA synthase
MALTQALAAGPSDPVLPRTTLGDMLREAARLSPGQVALRCDRSAQGFPSTFTYAELLEQSELCARRLLSDFRPGDRIAIWADNRPEWVVLLFGTALVGIIVVTVNPALRPQEARYVLRQSRACACFTVPVYRGAALADIARGFQVELAALRYVHNLEDFAAFMAGPKHTGNLPVVTPDDALMIQYTSGTTGFPKGALLLHGQLVNNAQLSALRAEVPEHCVWLSPLPLFHTGGSVLSAMGAFSRRATFVLMSAWNAEEALRLAELHRANVLCAVPTMLIAILDHPDLARRDVRSLTCIITGGAPVPAPVTRALQDRLGADVCNVFGQTESGPVATMTDAHDTPEDKQNTVGTAMPGYEVRIADPHSGATLKLGELGEFMVRGGNMAGYFENPDATRAALDAEGWLHTGDICSMDERGYVSLEGRITDMIIRGGENIYPREIEEVLMTEPLIRDVAVVGVPDDKWGELVVAFVVVAPGTTLDTDALTERLRGTFARFKIPERWIEVPGLPRTATGKVQKFVLRDQWKDGRFQ